MARKKSRVTYLVSGDANIQPSHKILRKSGKRVRYDIQVHAKAAVELRIGQRFVVVAHGRADGTVLWFSSARGTAQPWLWVGMPTPPRDTRLYIYSCMAGKKLSPFLDRCETLGHKDVVPMPLDGSRLAVLGFLNKVDRLLGDQSLSPQDWAKELARYVNKTLSAEAEKPVPSLGTITAMLYLRRSMDYADT